MRFIHLLPSSNLPRLDSYLQTNKSNNLYIAIGNTESTASHASHRRQPRDPMPLI
jgi:hypothetical protein